MPTRQVETSFVALEFSEKTGKRENKTKYDTIEIFALVTDALHNPIRKFMRKFVPDHDHLSK